MQKWHKEGKKIHPKFVYIILVKTIRYLRTLPNIIELSLPEGDQNTFRVCGDVHGQYYDFMNIFSLFGYPSKETPYLFNGTSEGRLISRRFHRPRQLLCGGGADGLLLQAGEAGLFLCPPRQPRVARMVYPTGDD